MIKIIGPKDPKDYSAINTTSCSKNWSVGLSPFKLGPVHLYKNFYARILENGWQYSKVYTIHTDDWNEPTQEYWKWAIKGWNKTNPIRYPMGKGQKPLYCLWNDEKLSYIEARKKVFIPLYTKAVVKTDAFNQLKKLYKTQKNIVLWDFDGYDHDKLGMTLEDVVNNPHKIMGHAFILKMILLGEI